MSQQEGKRTVAVATACMTASGLPTFALTEVAVTPEEAENGLHYCLAEGQLLEEGYEEPMVHFDENEAPAFLHPAVRQHLGLPPAFTKPTTILSEERRCPA